MMVRQKCTVCLGRKGTTDSDAMHEIKVGECYVHLCDFHFWGLHEYFIKE